jgi:hypothetical protein
VTSECSTIETWRCCPGMTLRVSSEQLTSVAAPRLTRAGGLTVAHLEHLQSPARRELGQDWLVQDREESEQDGPRAQPHASTPEHDN